MADSDVLTMLLLPQMAQALYAAAHTTATTADS